MTAMAVYGFEVYGAGDHRPVRARARRLPAAAARAARGPGALARRSSAAPTSSTSATRGCSGCCWRRSRCATRAPPATPPRSPTTRTSSPAPPGCPSASRRSSTPPACCTTSARRRCPTTSWSAAAELHPAERRLIERHPADGARAAAARRGHGRGRRGRARPPRAHRRPGLPGRPRRATSIPMAARILAVAEVYDVLTAAGLLPPADAPPPRPRTSCAASPARSSTAGSCGCSRPRSCAARQHRAPRPHRRPRGRAAGPAPRPRRARRPVRARPARLGAQSIRRLPVIQRIASRHVSSAEGDQEREVARGRPSPRSRSTACAHELRRSGRAG